MRKINMLKLSIQLYRISIFVMIFTFSISTFIKLVDKTSVSGVYKEGVLTFHQISSSTSKLQINSEVKIIHVDTGKTAAGKIINIQKIDFGLSQGLISEYKVLILNKDNIKNNTESLQDYTIISSNQQTLLHVLLEQVIGL